MGARGNTESESNPFGKAPVQLEAAGSQPRRDCRAARGAAYGTSLVFLMQCVVDLKLRLEKLDVRMVPGAARAGEAPGPRLPQESKEDQEERVLAMLGIMGTILNLLVIIFVYVYTTI